MTNQNKFVLYTYYYFDNIIKFEDFDLDNALID